MSLLSDLLQGIPLNAVLKERVALAEQKFKDIEAENRSLKGEVESLTTENSALKTELKESRTLATAAEVKPVVVKGCYRFEGDANLYCPACYDTKGKKYLTTQIMFKNRVCSVCKVFLGE